MFILSVGKVIHEAISHFFALQCELEGGIVFIRFGDDDEEAILLEKLFAGFKERLGNQRASRDEGSGLNPDLMLNRGRFHPSRAGRQERRPKRGRERWIHARVIKESSRESRRASRDMERFNSLKASIN